MKKLLLNLIIGIFLLFFSSLLGQQDRYFFGVQTHLAQVPRPLSDTVWMAKALDSIKASGANFIRDECLWSELEKTPGVYEFPASIDWVVKAAISRGIDVLLILNYNNTLYCGNNDPGTGPATDSNRAAYARYCKAMVNHFTPMGVKMYEIWNEPNNVQFWKPTPNPLDYVKLLQVAYPAIKQIDSTITVIGCATSPLEDTPPGPFMWKYFIQNVWSNGGGNYMDAVSFHQYKVDKTPEAYLLSDINALISITGTKPVFITELGYHTASVWPNLSLLKQAYYVSKLYIIGKSVPALRSLMYYDFRNDGTNLSDPEHNFGLVYNDFSPKPAYNTYKNTVSSIKGKSFINYTKQGDYYKFLYENISESVTVFFSSTSATQTKNEIFSRPNLLIKPLLGEPYFKYVKNKTHTVTYKEDPLFIHSFDALPPINRLEILPPIDTLIPGQKVNLKLIGYTPENIKVYIDSLSVEWVALSSNISVDSSGLLTALQPGIAVLSANFAGKQINKTFTVIDSYEYLEIESFSDTSGFSVSFFQLFPTTSVKLVDSAFITPPRSFLIDYSFKYEGIDRHRVIFDCDYPLFGEPDSILIDIFSNGNGHVAEFQIADADNELFKVNTSQIPVKFGWITAKARLTGFGSSFNFPARLKKIVFYIVKNSGIKDSVYNGKILLDNLRIHSSIPVNIESEEINIAKDFTLNQNFPNPFNPSTEIQFILPVLKNALSYYKVNLTVFDMLGRPVETLLNEIKRPGSYSIMWNAKDYPSGVYFYRLSIPGFSQIKKMLLLK